VFSRTSAKIFPYSRTAIFHADNGPVTHRLLRPRCDYRKNDACHTDITAAGLRRGIPPLEAVLVVIAID
jgi:hypothetical protein